MGVDYTAHFFYGAELEAPDDCEDPDGYCEEVVAKIRKECKSDYADEVGYCSVGCSYSGHGCGFYLSMGYASAGPGDTEEVNVTTFSDVSEDPLHWAWLEGLCGEPGHFVSLSVW